MAISTADFRNGLTIETDRQLFQIVYFQHVKPGKGGAFVKTRLRNLRTGAVVEKTFRAGERMEPAYLERRTIQFLYRAGDDYVFMDTETYDQSSLGADQLGDKAEYLKEGIEVSIVSHDGRLLGIDLPDTVELRVTQTDPGLRGDTASGGSKPATLETGAVVTVPLFVNEGDLIRVDTRSGKYLERVT